MEETNLIFQTKQEPLKNSHKQAKNVLFLVLLKIKSNFNFAFAFDERSLPRLSVKNTHTYFTLYRYIQLL